MDATVTIVTLVTCVTIAIIAYMATLFASTTIVLWGQMVTVAITGTITFVAFVSRLRLFMTISLVERVTYVNSGLLHGLPWLQNCIRKMLLDGMDGRDNSKDLCADGKTILNFF